VKRRRAIHKRIAQLREERGLSQQDLAEVLGVDKTSISHWENGLSSPRGSRLPAVASALGVTIDDLFREAA